MVVSLVLCELDRISNYNVHMILLADILVFVSEKSPSQSIYGRYASALNVTLIGACKHLKTLCKIYQRLVSS